MDIKGIIEALDLICEACGEIKDYDRCEDCPICSTCMEEESLTELADSVSQETWERFFDFANHVEFSEADLEAQHADFMRKYEEEERMIDDEYD